MAYQETERADYLMPAEIGALQAERWAQQAAYVTARSDFYRSLLRGRPIDGRLEGLAELPSTDKEMLRQDQRLHPPFGSYLASAPDEVSRVHRTSGTTGIAMNLALSARDARMTAEVGARGMRASGLGPGHRVVHCLNYQMWMGGYTDHAILEATGATVVPFGVGNTENLVRVIQDLSITAISCTPSYPKVIEAVIAEHFAGLSPRDLGLQLGLFGGEAGLDDQGFRSRLEATWGFKVRNANFGVSDVLSIVASQTEASDDLHMISTDVLYPELIDADSGRTLPWREGETGELVLTHLAKDCQPLVRFRTGDIITLTGLGTAPCGRTTPRFRVIGRADDMVVVRGLNMFPSMVGGVVSRFEELSGEYRITLDRPPPYDALPLEVELAADRPAVDSLGSRIEAVFKKELGASARVTVLPARTLPRTEGKTKRVVRTSGAHAGV